MKSLNIKSLVAALALAGMAVLPAAHAADATANFQVTAQINASCLVSATDIAFGAITPAAPTNRGVNYVDASGTINATCANTTPYTLAINGGLENDVYARKMRGSTAGNADKLSYQLYSNPSFEVWGQTVGTDTVSETGNGVVQSKAVYAKLNQNQFVTPDDYSDNLVVTLSY